MASDIDLSLLDCLCLAWCLLKCPIKMQFKYMCTKHHLILEFHRRSLVEGTLIGFIDMSAKRCIKTLFLKMVALSKSRLALCEH